MAFENVILFAKGAAAGIAIAAPVGPVGVLCVRRTLESGRLLGLVAGLGAAVADALFGAVAAFGLTLVSNWMAAHETLLRAAGGALLLALALRSMRARPAGEADSGNAAARGWPQVFASTFILTATNPITIVAFLGIFGALGIGAAMGDRYLALVLVAGVFSGSSLWWLALAGGAGMLRPWLDAGGMGRIGRISGLLLLLFALWALAGIALPS